MVPVTEKDGTVHYFGMCQNSTEMVYIAKGYKMPYIVCVIDEFADLIMFDKNVEKYVQMLAQKSRAAGIHLVVATQRPSVDVITGTVKANLPTRLSYKVSSAADSMTILNTAGAEDLLGRGDSLLLEENGTLTRILGAYVSDEDIMKTLEQYRCQFMDNDFTKRLNQKRTQRNAVVSASGSKAVTTNTVQEQKKGFFRSFISWIAGIWNSFTKTEKKRVVKFVISAASAVIAAKASQGSERKTTKRRR